MVLWDFNAHMGMLEEEKGWGKPNLQGVLSSEVMYRCQLYLSWQYQNLLQLYVLQWQVTNYGWLCLLMLRLYLWCLDATPSPSMIWTPLRTQAERDGSIMNYKQKVFPPTFTPFWMCVEDINRELEFIYLFFVGVSDGDIKVESQNRFKDATLSTLCAQSSLARCKWTEEGRPTDGPTYEGNCGLHHALRKRVRFCAAHEENPRIQCRKKLFATNYYRGFRKRCKGSKKPHKLYVNGKFCEWSWRVTERLRRPL